MRKIYYIFSFAAAMAIISFVLLGRKYIGNLPQDKILEIVKKDTIIFRESEIPAGVLDKLAENKVIVVGEYHNIEEHPMLLFQLTTGLNKQYKYNKLLVETPQTYSWIFEDYSTGIMPEVDEQTKKTFWFYVAALEKIREYNSDLPEEKRLSVHTIDVNHSPNSFVASLEFMQRFVKAPAKLKELTSHLKKNINDNQQYLNKLQEFKNGLEQNRTLYSGELGEKWVNRLDRMLEVELHSITCRNYLKAGKGDERYTEREKIIKSLVDDHLKTEGSGVIINVGAYHAQKKPFSGTKHEWLAEYLAFHSPYAKGKTFSLLVVPMRGSIENKNKVDVSKTIFKNELFNIISKYAGHNRAFLSYEDESFSKEKFLINHHYGKNSLMPKQQYDGVLLLPESTYVNPFP